MAQSSIELSFYIDTHANMARKKSEPLGKFIGDHTFDLLSAKARDVAASTNKPWNAGLTVILKALVANPDLSPKISAIDLNDWLDKWLTVYFRGHSQRASERVSSPPTTAVDPAILVILQAKLPKLSTKRLERIVSDHRLAMSAENILGHLLEQYVAEKLEPHGWHACWGQVIKIVDFAHADGRLLQIKNRSNSENSASSSVRHDTIVVKWYRSEATTGKTHWDSFPVTLDSDSTIFSEDDFQSFIRKVIAENPDALALEEAADAYIASSSDA